MSEAPLQIVFFGTPEIASVCLAALVEDPQYRVKAVVTQPDRPAGRGNKILPPPVKVLALSKNIPLIQPQRIKKNLPEFLSQLSALGPFDIGVVVAFGQILPQAVLDLPKSGCVNVHASLLPRWRGAAPIQRAIMSGDSQTGVCLMKMEAALDTGPVYSMATLNISPDDTSGSLLESLGVKGAALLRSDLAAIASGALEAKPQAAAGVTYAEKISNDEAQIHWDMSADSIERLVRGLNPVPGAFTFLNGSRFKIFRSRALPQTPPSGAPGTLSECSAGKLWINCGSGVISVVEGQFEGKRRAAVEEILRGGMITADSRFGPK